MDTLDARSTSHSKEAFVDGGPGPPAEEDLWQWLERASQQDDETIPALRALYEKPDLLSSLLPEGTHTKRIDSKCLSWSYKQLKDAAVTVAAYFSSHGVRPDDVITTYLPNSVEWAVFFWAAIRLRATFVPLDPRSLARASEVTYMVELARSTVIVVNDAQMAHELDNCLIRSDASSKVKLKMTCQPSEAMGKWRCLASISPEGSGEIRRPSSTEPYTALLLFTSGTTNKPKGCPTRNDAMAVQCNGYTHDPKASWNRDMKFILTTANFRPLYWLASFTTWYCGGTVVLTSPSFDFNVDATLSAIVSESITHVFTVPDQVRQLVRHADMQGNQPTTIEYINITGDIVNRSLMNLCKEKLRVARVVSIWGMTEGAAIMNWATPEDIPFTDPSEGEIPGVGRILRGAKAKICRGDTREVVERNQIGELHVSAPNFLSGYLEGRSPETFYSDASGDKWLITGDKAKVSDDGVVFIMGRSKDTIVKNGINLVPAVIEGLLNKQPGIEDVCFERSASPVTY